MRVHTHTREGQLGVHNRAPGEPWQCPPQKEHDDACASGVIVS